ncbi:BaiN/RdsA family NAD(P)/FAD-dependent oxidoreductase [Rhodoflexus caldus]|uniref:NAD(P)/FAD-dependent oxidoreductase n=1 Tax=Rhodoflexus caldus TaxID=2891236 RepID=UPI00202A73AC|nr:NAD(P)/FAD-dependent oxidoreductase [Rhodoflexus caldus]
MADVAVIGGGAAGFFAAIHAAKLLPDKRVLLMEKANKLLMKVKISGGGRCNVTHACFNVSEMSKNYPRGEKIMKKLLPRFMTTDTVQWFESRGVAIKAEADGRMFPTTDDSQSIINALMQEAHRNNVHIENQCEVTEIEPIDSQGFNLHIKGTAQPVFCRKLIVASGGSPKESGLEWLKKLGHTIEPPVPSLFTFNMPDESITELQGISVPRAMVKIIDSKFSYEGALLITHWGMSGPAILKLSAWGARWIAEKNYRFSIMVRWAANHEEDELRSQLLQYKQEHGQRLIGNRNPVNLPARLWEYLVAKIGLPTDKKWQDVGKTDINRLINILRNDTYQVSGKTTYKEEFVTCGGISLNDIDWSDMQSKKVPNLYFAGEVLDIDGITGGFNFQAAWTTGYVAGTSAARSLTTHLS